MTSKKSLIVFDIDGTLTDSVAAHHRAFREALTAIGVKTLNDQFHTYTHHTDSHIARVIYENDCGKSFELVVREKFEQQLHERIQTTAIVEIPGAKDFVDFLENESEFGVCYATGSLFRPAKHKLEQIGISFNSELLITSDELEEREAIVQKAIDKAGNHYGVRNFEQIILIGDGLWDLKTAQKLGLEFIGIGRANKQILFDNGMELQYDDFTTVTRFGKFRNSPNSNSVPILSNLFSMKNTAH